MRLTFFFVNLYLEIFNYLPLFERKVAMSASTKNLHVHFDDDYLASRNGLVAETLNYSREQLLEFGQSEAAKELPKMFDLSGADDKRIEKIRHVLKNSDIWKSLNYSKYSFFFLSWSVFPFENFPIGRLKWNNYVTKWTFCAFHGINHTRYFLCVALVIENGAENVSSKGSVAESNDQARTNFQQMISAAVSNAHQQNAYSDAANRRRIGSGRIPESNYNARDNIYSVGMDVRYMRNKLFKDDGKIVKNWKSSNDTNWNHLDPSSHADDNDNADAKSDEPEWANCGPIS